MCKKLIKNSKKLTENNIPETVRIEVHHFHPHNSSRKARKGHTYMTMAKLYDRKSHKLMGHGEAHCSSKEAPRRNIGRMVAVGRAMREAGFGEYTQYGEY